MTLDLEQAVLAVAPDDAPDVAAFVAESPAAATSAPSLADLTAPQAEALAPSALISLDLFQQRFALVHDMAGGMVQARTGKPCPLGAQARSEGGIAACAAFYSICETSPLLASWFLSEEMSFVGKVLAIGMHGFACIQVIKASAAEAPAEAAAQ